jgi:hypothetical protein
MDELILAGILSGAALGVLFVFFYIVLGILEDWKK